MIARHGRSYEFQLSFTIDYSSMTNHVNHDHPLIAEDLVQDAIVTDTELEESGELARQCFGLNHVDIRSQPIHSCNDSAADCFVETLQLVKSGI